MTAGYRIVQELSRVSFSPGTASKRFVRDIAANPPDFELSVRQEAYIWRIAYHMRRQLPKDLAEEAVRRKVDHDWVLLRPHLESVPQCSVCGQRQFSRREINAPCPGPPVPKPPRKRKPQPELKPGDVLEMDCIFAINPETR